MFKFKSTGSPSSYLNQELSSKYWWKEKGKGKREKGKKERKNNTISFYFYILCMEDLIKI